MTDYFMLECFVPKGATIVDIRDYPLIDGVESWLMGLRFDATLPEPILLEWDPSTDGLKKKFYDASIPLMTKELVAALRSGGVDNFDCYEVRITDRASGVVDDGYLAVNILGVVAAADLRACAFEDPSGRRLVDMDFDRLQISTTAARGLLLFRLAECVTGLVVHSAVKKHLEAQGGFGLSFVAPQSWIG